jgi:signal transduction histidine kinase
MSVISLRRRLLVPTLLLLAVVAGALAYLSFSWVAQTRALRRDADDVRAATALVYALTDACHEEERLVLASSAGAAPRRAPEHLDAADDRILELMREIQALPLRPRAARVWAEFVDTRASLRGLAAELRERPPGRDPGPRAAWLDQWQILSTRGDALLRSFTAFHLRLLERTVEDLHHRRQRTLWVAAGAVAAGLVVALAFTSVLSRTVLRPLGAMAKAAQRVSAAGPASPIPGADRPDEIGVVARSFNEMTGRLVHAVQARDEFLSVASHELKTPMTPLLARLQQLLRVARDGEGPVDRERVVRATRTLERNVVRLRNLVENLLDVSSITAGKLALRLEDGPAAELVAAAVARACQESCEGECPVRVSCERDVRIRADRGRLDQAIANLVANALKYAPAAPVEVRVAADGVQLVVEVEDSGAGIDPAEHERIFRRFERAVADPYEVSGLGLGLFISREIATAHGGELTLRSAPGRGATFALRIPVVLREAAAAGVTPAG